VKQDPKPDNMRLVLGVIRGLKYLHDKEVIHGDLRASNIMINDDGVACVADFGLTFVIDHSEFTTSKIAGPARWTAPEILDPPEEFQNVPPYSKASDMFAFGMAVIEIYTQKVPYSDRRNDSSVIFLILDGKRPDMPESLKENEPFRDIVQRCWEKEAGNRPTAQEVCSLLDEIVDPQFTANPQSIREWINSAFFYVQRLWFHG